MIASDALTRSRDCIAAAARWLLSNPRRAWGVTILLVLGLAGWEVSYWPRHGFPGALWHYHPRGGDIEQAQARAAVATWKDIGGFWTGRMIQGYQYYRPLTSCLFVAEYRLFGADDGLWAWVSIPLHLAVVLALLWATAALAPGAWLQRLGTGALAAVLFSAPFAADQAIESWIAGWWPCQSESLSLLFGLLLLGAIARYCRTGRRGWADLALPALLLAVVSKEMGYVAGIGACLLLLRSASGVGLEESKRAGAEVRPSGSEDEGAISRSRCSPPLPGSSPPLRTGPGSGHTAVLMSLAGLGAGLFVLRWWAVGRVGGYNPAHWHDLRALEKLFCPAFYAFCFQPPWYHLALLAGAVGLAAAIPRRSPGERIFVGVAVYVVAATALFGPPWQGMFAEGTRAMLAAALDLTLVVGVLLAARRWPVAEVAVIYLLSGWMVVGFPPVFGWYRYWCSAFGCLLTAISVVTLAGYAWPRFKQAPRLRN